MNTKSNKETFAYQLALSVQLATSVIGSYCKKVGITESEVAPKDLDLYLEAEAINRLTKLGDNNV